MWDSIEDLEVTPKVATEATIEPKSADYKAEQWRWFPWTIPGAFIILAAICGAIWYFMYSGNEEEKEEEGL
jgi:disulfide bond formation protein DsbB